MKTYKFSDFLKRYKSQIMIEDELEYKQVTIKTNHKGVLLRDIKKGIEIGTKKQFTIKEGQFILSKIDARNGAFGIVPKELENAIITGNFWTYNVNSDIINVEWLNLFTSSPDFLQICIDTSTGTTNRKYLNENMFLSYSVTIPDLIKQQETIELFRKISHIENKLYEEVKIIEDIKIELLKKQFEE